MPNLSLTPASLALAFIAAAGMLLIVIALGLLSHTHLRLGGQISLADESRRIAGVTPDELPFIERVLAPIVTSLQTRSSEGERAWAEQAYDLLDRKHSSSDYFMRKVLWALAGFAFGIILGLVMANTSSGSLLPLLIAPLALSLLGYQLPRWELQMALSRRREQMFFEVPYVLDRLGVNVMAHHGDLVEGMQATCQLPFGQSFKGSYLMRELLQVVEDNAKAGHIDRALARMAARNSDSPMIVRIAELLTHSQQVGTDLNQALQDIGDRALDEVENLIRRRGEENSQAMIAPSMIALIGVMVALLGPAMIDLSRFFR